jgi:hypothetical protein
MININLEIKDKFAEMCKLIFINSKGEFCFPFENFQHDDDWSEFKNHNDWSILETKMNNLLKLVTEDNSVLLLDVQEEIWERI